MNQLLGKMQKVNTRSDSLIDNRIIEIFQKTKQEK